VQDAPSIKKQEIWLENGVEGVPILNFAGSGFQRKGFRKKMFSIYAKIGDIFNIYVSCCYNP